MTSSTLQMWLQQAGQQQNKKKVLSDSHCARESMDNEQQARTEIQDREKSKAGERETELNRTDRNENKKRWWNGEAQEKITQDKGRETREKYQIDCV